MVKIYPKRIQFILVSALYYNTIMLSSMKFITYIYYYLIPLIYLTIHYRWVFKKIRYISERHCGYIIFGLIVQTIASIIIPIVKSTYDLTYFYGPILQIYKCWIAYLFLLCLYEHMFKGKATFEGYIDTFIYAIACYVVGTLIICAIPSLHQWVIDNLNSSEFADWQLRQSDAYTRIGWSGFSNFFPTFYCSLCTILCLGNMLKGSRGKAVSRKYNVLAIICLIGNFCYGRIGAIVSLLAYLVYYCILLYRKPIKSFKYPIMFVGAGIILVSAASTNPRVRDWFNWAFAQIIQYRKSGSFATYTIQSLISMYKMPPVSTLFLGDGIYFVSEFSYYMGTDVGWLRPIYFYGLFFSAMGFINAIRLIITFVKQNYDRRTVQYRYMFILLILLYLLFESKGEIFYTITSLLFPLLFFKTRELQPVK